MSDYRLSQRLYVLPAPSGAYFSVSSPERDRLRVLLSVLFSYGSSPLLTLENLCDWAQTDDHDEAMELLFQAQNLGWVEGFKQPRKAPTATLEVLLEELLPSLSSSGKTLLADGQGFCLASTGFSADTAEELAALSADLASLHERHDRLLRGSVGLNTSAWGVVDAAGNSQLGFWPLYLGESPFVLVVAGMSRMNQPALTDLIWVLHKRYKFN